MEELDLKELFFVFWHKKVQIIIIVFIFCILGVFYTSLLIEPKYKSSTTLILAKVDSEATSTSESITQTELTLNQKLVSTYSELIKSKSILREVINNLEIDISEDKLANNVSISLVNNTELINITISDEEPQRAADMANELAKVFTQKVSEIYNINNVHVVDKAEVSNVAYNINHSKDIFMFMGLGVVVSTIYVFIYNMLDTTIKTSEDIERKTKLTVIASIPRYDIVEKKGGNNK